MNQLEGLSQTQIKRSLDIKKTKVYLETESRVT